MCVNCARLTLVRILPILLCLGIAIGRAQISAASSADAIDEGNKAWILGMKTGDAGVIAETYALDAVDCGTKGDCEHGRPAILVKLQERLARIGHAASASVTSHGSTVQGEFVYEWGEASAQFDNGQHVGGRYLTVWQKQGGGTWKIFRNIAIP